MNTTTFSVTRHAILVAATSKAPLVMFLDSLAKATGSNAHQMMVDVEHIQSELLAVCSQMRKTITFTHQPAAAAAAPVVVPVAPAPAPAPAAPAAAPAPKPKAKAVAAAAAAAPAAVVPAPKPKQQTLMKLKPAAAAAAVAVVAAPAPKPKAAAAAAAAAAPPAKRPVFLAKRKAAPAAAAAATPVPKPKVSVANAVVPVIAKSVLKAATLAESKAAAAAAAAPAAPAVATVAEEVAVMADDTDTDDEAVPTRGTSISAKEARIAELAEIKELSPEQRKEKKRLQKSLSAQRNRAAAKRKTGDGNAVSKPKRRKVINVDDDEIDMAANSEEERAELAELASVLIAPEPVSTLPADYGLVDKDQAPFTYDGKCASCGKDCGDEGVRCTRCMETGTCGRSACETKHKESEDCIAVAEKDPRAFCEKVHACILHAKAHGQEIPKFTHAPATVFPLKKLKCDHCKSAISKTMCSFCSFHLTCDAQRCRDLHVATSVCQATSLNTIAKTACMIDSIQHGKEVRAKGANRGLNADQVLTKLVNKLAVEEESQIPSSQDA